MGARHSHCHCNSHIVILYQQRLREAHCEQFSCPLQSQPILAVAFFVFREASVGLFADAIDEARLKENGIEKKKLAKQGQAFDCVRAMSAHRMPASGTYVACGDHQFREIKCSSTQPLESQRHPDASFSSLLR